MADSSLGCAKRAAEPLSGSCPACIGPWWKPASAVTTPEAARPAPPAPDAAAHVASPPRERRQTTLTNPSRPRGGLRMMT
jgi:hypothetical protein